jgi:hypothetical protein
MGLVPLFSKSVDPNTTSRDNIGRTPLSFLYQLDGL